MKEYEVRLSGFCDPFWKAAMALKRAKDAKEPTESLREKYDRLKAELEQFLDCQRTYSGVIGAIATIPEWVGPIRGRIAKMDKQLSEPHLDSKIHHSAVLQLDTTLG